MRQDGDLKIFMRMGIWSIIELVFGIRMPPPLFLLKMKLIGIRESKTREKIREEGERHEKIREEGERPEKIREKGHEGYCVTPPPW